MADDQSMETNEQSSTNAPATTAGANTATADEDDRKLFAGGLPQEAGEEDINEHFSQYGEIESVNLKTDQHTGRSRGFCFIVFKEVASLESAVSAGDHVVKGKKVAVKKAQAKQGKVHISKLKPELSDEEIRDFFEQYGAIAGVEQPYDKVKQERKNFCFITFEKEDTAKRLLKEGTVNVKGFDLEVNKVTPKAPGGGMFGGGGRGGGYAGGYGGGWGGYGGGGGAAGGAGGDYWGYGGGYDAYGGGGYGGYGQGGGWGGYGGGQGFGGAHGGKTRGRGGAPRGGGRGQNRQKPY